MHLSVTIKSQIGKRRKLWKAVVNAANPNEAEKAWRLYSEGRRATHARIARERTASWRKFIAKGVDQIAENDMRGYWKFVNHVTGRRQEGEKEISRLSTLCLERWQSTRILWPKLGRCTIMPYQVMNAIVEMPNIGSRYPLGESRRWRVLMALWYGQSSMRRSGV